MASYQSIAYVDPRVKTFCNEKWRRTIAIRVFCQIYADSLQSVGISGQALLSYQAAMTTRLSGVDPSEKATRETISDQSCQGPEEA